MGKADRVVGTYGQADGAAVCEGLRPGQQDRCPGCSGNLRGNGAGRRAGGGHPQPRQPTDAGVDRVREGWIKQRTATANQIRGLLAEFGQVITPGMRHLRTDVGVWQDKACTELAMLCGVVDELLAHLSQLDERIAKVDQQIMQAHKDNAACRLIESIPGVGVMTATAVFSSFGRADMFADGRKFACVLGLTPRERSSGGKQVLLSYGGCSGMQCKASGAPRYEYRKRPTTPQCARYVRQNRATYTCAMH